MEYKNERLFTFYKEGDSIKLHKHLLMAAAGLLLATATYAQTILEPIRLYGS